MRRSKAPSMRLAAKRRNADPEPPEEPESPCAWPSNSPSMEWGSSKVSENLGPREIKPGENPLKESRIFHVLWRNQTTKKHKTWTGNGTLVVTGTNVILKDDAGKVVDTMTCFKQRDFHENDQLEVGSKDVEVQEEIKTLEECVAQRKLEIASWCQKIDAKNGHTDTSPPNVASLPFRSHVLKKRMREETSELNQNDEASAPFAKCPAPFTHVEYLCMLAPAELQEKILRFLAEHIRNLKMDPPVMREMVQVVCDHPVLLKTLIKQTEYSDLFQLLEPQIPSWSEMGIYDSAKFEFVHKFLDNLVVEHGEKCCILANSQDCLRLIMGYCQSYDIGHVQLETPQDVDAFNSCEEMTQMVGLVLTRNLPNMRSLCCKNIVIYNHNATEEARKLLVTGKMDNRIYTLITSAGCPEEVQFYRQLSLNTHDDIVEDLQNYRNGLAPRITYELSSWTKDEPPFSEKFLQETALDDSVENLQVVYSKKKLTLE
ncbi:uncharacterized protein LOC108095973 [Drosophila ficusphila]|uniref:uncharacterized protein LOC108095973 n=1 Tax=Drosophila ficusphila TaxID=30025 RepID=UPI0007E6F2D3|nr:uncharacterized protein LOC108095973 [Drosophila ficusphila]XP_017052805.1 uncharacterized protein LOC108095973 [Drosophila ficusphila]